MSISARSSLAFNRQRTGRRYARAGRRPRRGGASAGALDTRALTLQIAQAQARSAVQEQVLLRLKNGTRPEEVAQARAEVAAAQAEADLAEQLLKRLQEIEQDSGGQAVSQQDLDSARTRAAAWPWRSWKTARRRCSWLGSVRARKTSRRPRRSLNVVARRTRLAQSPAQPGGIESADRCGRALAPAGAGRHGLAAAAGLSRWPSPTRNGCAPMSPEADLGRIKPGMAATRDHRQPSRRAASRAGSAISPRWPSSRPKPCRPKSCAPAWSTKCACLSMIRATGCVWACPPRCAFALETAEASLRAAPMAEQRQRRCIAQRPAQALPGQGNGTNGRRRSTTCRWKCRRARSPRWSARTAPARPRCCGWSPG